MTRRIALLAASLACLAVAAAACSGGSDSSGSGPFDLSGGTYEFTIAGVGDDSCWPDDNLVPPEAVAAIDLLVNASGAELQVVPNPAAAWYFQPLVGTREGNELLGLTGNGVLVATSNCSVAVSSSGSGLIVDDHIFDLTLRADLSAMASGTSGGCAPLESEDVPGTLFPFPVLTNPTDGTCSVSFSGTAVRAE